MTPLTPPGPTSTEGNPEATVVTFPPGLILEIRAVSPPVSGPGPPPEVREPERTAQWCYSFRQCLLLRHTNNHPDRILSLEAPQAR